MVGDAIAKGHNCQYAVEKSQRNNIPDKCWPEVASDVIIAEVVLIDHTDAMSLWNLAILGQSVLEIYVIRGFA